VSPDKCAACGAAIAPAAQWCGLCYAPVRTAPLGPGGREAARAAQAVFDVRQAVLAFREPDAREPAPPLAVPTATGIGAAAVAGRRRGRHAAPVDGSEPAPDLDFALTSEDSPIPRLTTGTRLGVMLGGALGMIGVLLGLGWGIGSLL
jgi:hypothetical protein